MHGTTEWNGDLEGCVKAVEKCFFPSGHMNNLFRSSTSHPIKSKV